MTVVFLIRFRFLGIRRLGREKKNIFWEITICDSVPLN